MRVLVAGVLGGFVMFVWGMAAHMALPIGMMGMQTAVDQDTAIASVQGAAGQGAGVYMLPGMAPDAWRDETARAAFIDKYRASPYAFIVYQPAGNPAISSMAPNLVKQGISVTLAAIVLAWVLALGPFGFGKRVGIAAAIGLFAWLAISVPYWNWYLFPTEFTLGAMLEQVIGWTLAGMAIAWWLGRSERRATI